jgi:hypothetical protein
MPRYLQKSQEFQSLLDQANSIYPAEQEVHSDSDVLTPVDIQSAVNQTASAHLTEHAAEESCIFLDEPEPFKEGPILDFVSTTANHFSECNKGKNELACKILTQLAPAIGKGIAKGLINSANPFNALLVPYYKIKLIADVSGFALQETYNFAQYVQYKLSGQQADADKMLAMCAEPFKQIAATWDTLDDAAKFEMASQIFTEIIAGGKVSQICGRFKKTVLEKAGTLAPSNGTIAKGLNLISKYTNEYQKQLLALGIVEDGKTLTTTLQKELKCEGSALAKYEPDMKELEKYLAKMSKGENDITHIKRTFKNVEGFEVIMESGHGYFRDHLGGNVSHLGSLNEIEGAILDHCKTKGIFGKLKFGDKTERIPLTFKEQELEYKVFNTGKYFSIDYYPKKEA